VQQWMPPTWRGSRCARTHAIIHTCAPCSDTLWWSGSRCTSRCGRGRARRCCHCSAVAPTHSAHSGGRWAPCCHRSRPRPASSSPRPTPAPPRSEAPPCPCTAAHPHRSPHTSGVVAARRGGWHRGAVSALRGGVALTRCDHAHDRSSGACVAVTAHECMQGRWSFCAPCSSLHGSVRCCRWVAALAGACPNSHRR
jgi:hypothetical protein